MKHKTRDEIIITRLKDEKAPPIGNFKDLPIKDCMAIYAEQYAKKCLDLAYQALLERVGWYTSEEDAIKNIEFPKHD